MTALVESALRWVRQFEDCVRSLVFDRGIADARRRHAEASARGDRGEEDRWLAELNRLQSERKRRPDIEKR